MPQKLNIDNLEKIRQDNPFVAEAFDAVARAMGNMAEQTNASLHGSTAAPPAPTSVNVTAAGGIFDVAITDNNPVQRGINYFVEYSDNPSFVKPRVIDLGQSRNERRALGNQTLYFRAYSSYPTSPRSDAVYHGGSATNPVAVAGGGATSGPALQASQGSGTTEGANGGDGGFGNAPVRLPK
jgi:hypothetical protein